MIKYHNLEPKYTPKDQNSGNSSSFPLITTCCSVDLNDMVRNDLLFNTNDWKIWIMEIKYNNTKLPMKMSRHPNSPCIYHFWFLANHSFLWPIDWMSPVWKSLHCSSIYFHHFTLRIGAENWRVRLTLLISLSWIVTGFSVLYMRPTELMSENLYCYVNTDYHHQIYFFVFIYYSCCSRLFGHHIVLYSQTETVHTHLFLEGRLRMVLSIFWLLLDAVVLE